MIEEIECDICGKQLGFFSNGCDDFHNFYCSKECIEREVG